MPPPPRIVSLLINSPDPYHQLIQSLDLQTPVIQILFLPHSKHNVSPAQTRIGWCCLRKQRLFKARIVWHGPCVAQRVSPQPLTTQVRIRSQANECEIYGERSGKRTGFCPCTSVSSSQYHCTSVPYSFIHHQSYVILTVDGVLNTTKEVTQTRKYTAWKKNAIFLMLTSGDRT